MAQLFLHGSTINYADGGERKMLSIVSDPSFDESKTYRNYRGEWNIYYHLSPLRKNLFAWYDFPRGTSILELGAGCGALTSYLASLPDMRVVAVEGSAARAKVIAERCRAYENVEVHACDINTVELSEKFDVVTLIGVLEYAGKFSTGKHPFHDTLLMAKSRLKENGTLLLAIENKLGHKYLAGIAEDHYGTPFEGINNYPHFNGVRTFDYTELNVLLTEGGFTTKNYVFPFPDYKLPDLVVTESGLKTPGFDPFALFNLPSDDHMSARKPLFNELEFLRSTDRIKQSHLFMNSFLIFASPSGTPALAINPDILAVRLNSFRVPPFATRVFFHKKNSEIWVRKEPLDRTATPYPIHKDGIIFNPQIDNGPYYSNWATLEDKIIGAIREKKADELTRILNFWLDLIIQKSAKATPQDIQLFETFCRSDPGSNLYSPAYNQDWIDGGSFDLVLDQIVENDLKNKTAIIDREVSLSVRVPLQLLFDRAIAHLREKIIRFSPYIGADTKMNFPIPAEVVYVFKAHPLISGYNEAAREQFDSRLQNRFMNHS